MGLNLAVDMSAYPADKQLGITGVGVFTNGGEGKDLTEQQEGSFYAVNGYTIQDSGQEGVTVTGSPDFTPPEPVEDQPTEQTTQENTPTPEAPAEESGLPQDNPPAEEGGA